MVLHKIHKDSLRFVNTISKRILFALATLFLCAVNKLASMGERAIPSTISQISTSSNSLCSRHFQDAKLEEPSKQSHSLRPIVILQSQNTLQQIMLIWISCEVDSVLSPHINNVISFSLLIKLCVWGHFNIINNSSYTFFHEWNLSQLCKESVIKLS